MGKRYQHLWRQVISMNNLYLAFHKASRGNPAERGASHTWQTSSIHF